MDLPGLYRQGGRWGGQSFLRPDPVRLKEPLIVATATCVNAVSALHSIIWVPSGTGWVTPLVTAHIRVTADLVLCKQTSIISIAADIDAGKPSVRWGTQRHLAHPLAGVAVGTRGPTLILRPSRVSTTDTATDYNGKPE